MAKDSKIDIEQTISYLQEVMDEGNKSASIKRLKTAMNRLDQDKIDVSDVESAIEEYEGITRSGMSAEEYADEKQTAFDAINEAIEGLELTEGEDEEDEAPIQAAPTGGESSYFRCCLCGQHAPRNRLDPGSKDAEGNPINFEFGMFRKRLGGKAALPPELRHRSHRPEAGSRARRESWAPS